jgi:hypothetical protein
MALSQLNFFNFSKCPISSEFSQKVCGWRVGRYWQFTSSGSYGGLTSERTEPFCIGHHYGATFDNGSVLLETFSHDVAKWIERVIAWDGSSWEG